MLILHLAYMIRLWKLSHVICYTAYRHRIFAIIINYYVIVITIIEKLRFQLENGAIALR